MYPRNLRKKFFLSFVIFFLLLIIIYPKTFIFSITFKEGKLFVDRMIYDITITKREASTFGIYHDNGKSFKTRKNTEFHFKKYLKTLNKTDLEILQRKYHRNISIQLSERDLLPHSKPIFHQECLKYLDTPYSEKVSIVIPFHNELLMLLYRTLTTLVHRTSYLLEIILIDDASDDDYESDVLDFCEKLNIPVRYFKNQVRLGITESRRKGIWLASGSVVVILDSHIEVMELWLEPLLDMLHENPHSIAIPCMAMISETRYAQKANEHCYPNMVKMRYGWGLLMFSYTSLPKSHHDPYSTPAMAGGALAAHRDTLLQYYPTAKYGSSWGVENNKLSLRAWLCGGGIYMSCCSQITHVNGDDAQLTRYQKDDKKLFDYLVAETFAEIWTFIGDKQLREKVLTRASFDEEIKMWINKTYHDSLSEWNPLTNGCKTYDHYLRYIIPNHVYFDRTDFDYVGLFQSSSSSNEFCLECSYATKKLSYWKCRTSKFHQGGSQMVGLAKNHGVKCGFPDAESTCWDAPSHLDEVLIQPCHTRSAVADKHGLTQKFSYDRSSRRIKHVYTERCIELVPISSGTEGMKFGVRLRKCSNSVSQVWSHIPAPWF